MRALLDTNIIIHRENKKATSQTIGQLFYWLDKLHFEKLIHPYTIKELRKYCDSEMQALYDSKIAAYTEMKNIAVQTSDYKKQLQDCPKTDNDCIDNQLLFEVFCGRADILITEDRKMRKKAERLGIDDKVYSINAFISKCTNDNPGMISYKALSVKKTTFGAVDIDDSFFDTFKGPYQGFEKWFAKKCDEEAYICKNESNKILGFLYLKVEGSDENYSEMSPCFIPKRRLKVGTFKVESTGFRLGERFIKIIFDNAIAQKVDEVYVTLFTDRQELRALYELLKRWGFYEYGTKTTNGKPETVLVKKMNCYDNSLSIKENFPNLDFNHKKYYLPIEAEYHTYLLPDSKLNNEVDFLGDTPEKYALQKVYISFSYKRDMSPGDFLVLYRKGVTPGRKGYESVLTTVAVIDEVKWNFINKDEFFHYCENRTVFSKEELNSFWNSKQGKLLVIKFIFIKNLTKKLILKDLWDKNIVPFPSGPRPFDTMSDSEFNEIITDSQTEIYM
ncbi:PIN domain-containing protein [Pygmaiobacter massiliensis]|uniref:PIN domain-containing protein n=1 Tax=Pygmaiobacter massiliensis TaxID=1917873 RepID=UPI00289B1696|nr:PIN domain-containing protein [Pygmaiobacter massiliensis]